MRKLNLPQVTRTTAVFTLIILLIVVQGSPQPALGLTLASIDFTKDWVEYQDVKFGFNCSIPEDWHVAPSLSEGGGGVTIITSYPPGSLFSAESISQNEAKLDIGIAALDTATTILADWVTTSLFPGEKILTEIEGILPSQLPYIELFTESASICDNIPRYRTRTYARERVG